MEAMKLAYNPAGLRIGTADDGLFVKKIQKQFSESLGFLPGAAIDSYLVAGRVLIGNQNDQQAGYILGRPQMRYDPTIAPITQAAVAMDAQRRSLGLGLVNQWVTSAFLAGKACVQCWCADDLDSRFFWPAAGFTAIARRWPENSRRRSITLWRRSTSVAPLADQYFTLPPLAGFKATKIGRVSLLDVNGNEVSTDTHTPRPISPQLLLFDLMIDDGRLTTADCFR